MRTWIFMLLLFSSATQAAITGRVLRCESIDQERNYCLAYIRGGVKLERQLSLEDCSYQDSWGYDEGGVWVDKGCRAEFFIRETPEETDLSQEPDSSVTELMNMTIVAETVNKNKAADWSVFLGENIKIGVDYNEWTSLPVTEDWQNLWFLPALLKVNF